jgi:penicillin-binding protein 1A
MNRFLKFIFISSIISGSLFCGAFFYILHNHTIDFSPLEHYNPGKASILLDDEGNEWARFQLDKREPVTLAQMPPHLINAFIATEDHEFFLHGGISWRGIIRSIIVNAYRGRKVQGASTITQQLVRLLFFDAKKTFERKVKEQLYAILIERQFTKEQILETYLNHVYFGAGIYGVQAACQRFWGISVENISIGQAATLAGILRSPGNYCPLLFPASSEKRRNVVLSLMVKHTFISADEYHNAKTEQLGLVAKESTILAPHLRETIRLFLEELLGKQALYYDGLIIQTTLNRSIQQDAEAIFKKHCENLKKKLRPDIDGGLISMDVQSGEIKALIGGYDYGTSKFNRALQAKRQIGSILKPLIYAAALEQGINFTETEIDEPFDMPQPNGTVWSPLNYNDEFNGQITLAYGLSHSNNISAIKTLLRVGAKPIINLAKKCHIQGPFHEYPSLALGCIDSTLKEAVGMFNVFANSGVFIEPHFIKWVKNEWGTKIYKYNPSKTVVMDPKMSGQVSKVLMLALERIHKNWKGPWLNCQAMSKTGTTNDSRVCWYAGSTPTLTTAVYIGCDDNNSMGQNIYPARTAFPIWFGLNRKVNSAQKQFNFDPSLKEIIIDERTGRETYPNAEGAIKIFVQ